MQDDLEIHKGSEIKTNIEKLVYGGDGLRISDQEPVL